MGKKHERFFDFDISVNAALTDAQRVAAQEPVQIRRIGKQLRRDAANYLWRETGYNIALAVGVGGALAISASVEPRMQPYVAGLYVVGALTREALAVGRVVRLVKASFQYRRKSRA